MKSENELVKLFSECKSEHDAWSLIMEYDEVRMSIIDNYEKKLEKVKGEIPFLTNIPFVIPAFKFKLDDKEDLKKVVSTIQILCYVYKIHCVVDYNTGIIYV